MNNIDFGMLSCPVEESVEILLPKTDNVQCKSPPDHNKNNPQQPQWQRVEA